MANVKLVALKELKSAKHNPSSRTKDVSGLAKSIQRVGLLDPIKIDERTEVIDGHRRVEAYKRLGLTDIECIVLKGNAAEMYAELNAQSKKLTGNESMRVFLKNPEAVPGKHRLRLEEAVETLGDALFQRLVEAGASIATYNLAVRMARLNDRDNAQSVSKAVRWLLHFGCHGLAHKAINAGTAPGMIWAAVERNKPLRVSFAVGK